MMHFIRPDAFFLLIVALPLIASVWWLNLKLRQRDLKRYGEERLVGRFSEPLRKVTEGLVLAAWLFASALAITALAGPVTPATPAKVQEGSLQVVVLADVSKSMAAEDYRDSMPPVNGVAPDMVPGPYGTRLDMVKLVILKDLMPALQGNEIGICVYMGNGFDLVT